MIYIYCDSRLLPVIVKQYVSCLLPSFGTRNEGIFGKLMEIAQNQGQGMSGFLTNVGRTSPPVDS